MEELKKGNLTRAGMLSGMDRKNAGRCELTAPRLRGESKRLINYRHVVDSLLRKPGAFERYRYREEMFPSLIFRRAYDAPLS